MPEEQEEEDENDLYNISESSDLLSDEDESETETIAINLKKVIQNNYYYYEVYFTIIVKGTRTVVK